jgi:predicted nucleic acid-binding protein
VIYLDTSVVIAHLLGETLHPHDTLWDESLTSSRLLEYELRVTLHARGLKRSHDEAAQTLIDGIDFLELTPTILARAVDPFPTPVRTLHALHLASIEFLRAQRQSVELASYDRRMIAAAHALKIPLATL